MVFDTKCVTCLYAQNEIRRPLIANILFVSINLWTGNDFCEIFLPLWNYCVVQILTICIRGLKFNITRAVSCCLVIPV